MVIKSNYVAMTTTYVVKVGVSHKKCSLIHNLNYHINGVSNTSTVVTKRNVYAAYDRLI